MASFDDNTTPSHNVKLMGLSTYFFFSLYMYIDFRVNVAGAVEMRLFIFSCQPFIKRFTHLVNLSIFYMGRGGGCNNKRMSKF